MVTPHKSQQAHPVLGTNRGAAAHRHRGKLKNTSRTSSAQRSESADRGVMAHMKFIIRIPIEIPELEVLMAKIDDVAAQVQNLTEAVRSFVQRQADTIGQLQPELSTLQADDDVENSKLEGLSSAIDSLTAEVNSFGQTPVPVDPAEPEGETEPIAEEPVPGEESQ